MPRQTTGTKPERDELRRQMLADGCGYGEIANEMRGLWGFRPRTAWRHAYGWIQREVADRFNEITDDPNASMTGNRISDYENWPINGSGVKPTSEVLSILAKVFDTIPSQLVDFHDRQMLSRKEQIALDTHYVSSGGSVTNGGVDARKSVGLPVNGRPNADKISSPRKTSPRNFPWERLSEADFKVFLYRLLGILGFSDRDWSDSPLGRSLVAKRISQELPGRTRIENWAIVGTNAHPIVDADDIGRVLDWCEKCTPFDVLLFITAGYLSTRARDSLTRVSQNGSRPYRIQWIERDYLEEAAKLNEQLVDECFGDLMNSDHPAHPQMRARFFSDLRRAWASGAENSARFRAMHDVYGQYQELYGHEMPSDYASIYLMQSHQVEYRADGVARRTFRLHMVNIGSRPISRDVVYFRGEAAIGNNAELHLHARSLDPSLPSPGIEFGVDTYNLKVISLIFPHAIELFEGYEYEIGADWPYPGPLAKSRYYGMKTDRFTPLLKYAVSVPTGFTVVAPTVFEFTDKLTKRISEPVPIVSSHQVSMNGDIPLPMFDTSYRLVFALQEES